MVEQEVVTAPELLSIKDVAKMIGFSPSWIKESVKLGVFPDPIKVRGSTRWTQAQIKEWLKGFG